MHFFALIFTHFSLQNHYILWSNRLISSFDHNTSSLLRTQRMANSRIERRTFNGGLGGKPHAL